MTEQATVTDPTEEQLKKILFEPFDDILLIRIEKMDKTEGGIYIPELYQDQGSNTAHLQRAKVIKAGPDVKKVKVGDTIVIGHLTGNMATVSIYRGHRFHVIKEGNIWGIEY